MSNVRFVWKSTKWWILSAAMFILKWFKNQLKPNSVVIKIINDVTQFVSFLMIFHSKPVLKASTAMGPRTIPKKPSYKKKRKE